MQAAELAQARANILRWRADPVLWVRTMLRAEPDAWQADALMAMAVNDRLAIRSGHGVGKSTFMSWALLWFMNTRYPCKALVTGSNFDQLVATFWAEVGSWLNRLPEPVRREWEYTSEALRMRASATSPAAPQESFAALRTASKDRSQGLAGFHSPNQLVVIDEASAVDDSIFEVINGAMTTAGAKWLMTGNPTQRGGYFFKAFHEMRSRHWCKHVSSADSPRVSAEWIETQKDLYGEHSNAYRVRVLGEFPSQDYDGVIPLDLIEAAIGRRVEPIDVATRWGVDVAGAGEGGDRSALAKRQGNVLLEPVRTHTGLDPEQVAGWITREYLDTPVPLRPERVCVDGIGLGSGVSAKLKHTPVPVVNVMVSESPSQSDRFERLRDELWWKGREWFAAYDCRIPDDAELISELSTPKYQERPSGKIKVESKKELRTRGLRSPDKADAFLLTFAGPVSSVRLRNQRFEAHMLALQGGGGATYSDMDAP